ncbi:unnamed protein product [Arctia plantaginis]|uniref:Histone deacetylase n=1 Tax=Arctia plantaginis TaxID=874455 RepID=A0A8S0YPC9_ARCPL|nr:unnamed protein product [Arctia plantaginis]CAB3246264.1 unnamed protein product [Arctia plantaginis]
MNVCYVWDDKLIDFCDQLPAVMGRAKVVHCLIQAYGLHNKVKVVRSTPATYEELKEFHSELYLDHLKTFIDVDDDYMTSVQDEEYGIGYDCAPVSNMFGLVSHIAGSSVTASKCLVMGLADVAINWCGGWHHANRFGAEGFCYVNDVVIAIEKLRKKFSKVLYIDLDVHHGNGVQDAYNISKSVFTLSFHKYEPGFYPGTGGLNDIGTLSGTGYSCNMPLHAGYTDDTMEYAFEKVFNLVYSHFAPDAIVIQCGADALAHDPNGGAALTARSYCKCVRMVLDKRKPSMLLGGGGYQHSNAARLWTCITAMVAGVELDEQIPEHIYWPEYGPTYTIAIDPTLIKDANKSCYIEDCINTIKGNLEKYLGKSSHAEPVVKRLKSKIENAKETLRLDSKKIHKDKNKFRNTSVGIHNMVKHAQDQTNHRSKIVDKSDVYDFVE